MSMCLNMKLLIPNKYFDLCTENEISHYSEFDALAHSIK